MSELERRKWQRLQHGLRVELQILDAKGRTVTAMGTHLSPEGIFVQLADPPAADTPVRISINTNNSAPGQGDSAVNLMAEGVVITQIAPTDTLESTGVGIQLKEAGPAWRKLYQWLRGPE